MEEKAEISSFPTEPFVHPQIEGKFTVTPGGLTSVFYGSIVTSLWSKLVNAIIKKVMAPLDIGPEFAFN
jgi:hypothetical protein